MGLLGFGRSAGLDNPRPGQARGFFSLFVSEYSTSQASWPGWHGRVEPGLEPLVAWLAGWLAGCLAD